MTARVAAPLFYKYQYSNMDPRLSGQTSIFCGVFYVSKSLLGIVRQKKLKKLAILTRNLQIHVRLLMYRTWPIGTDFAILFLHFLLTLSFNCEDISNTQDSV